MSTHPSPLGNAAASSAAPPETPPTAAALDRRQPTNNDYPDDELAEQDRTQPNTIEHHRTESNTPSRPDQIGTPSPTPQQKKIPEQPLPAPPGAATYQDLPNLTTPTHPDQIGNSPYLPPTPRTPPDLTTYHDLPKPTKPDHANPLRPDREQPQTRRQLPGPTRGEHRHDGRGKCNRP